MSTEEMQNRIKEIRHFHDGRDAEMYHIRLDELAFDLIKDIANGSNWGMEQAILLADLIEESEDWTMWYA